MNESGADSDQKAYEGFKLPTNSTSPTSSSPELLHSFLETQAALAPKNLLQTNSAIPCYGGGDFLRTSPF